MAELGVNRDEIRGKKILLKPNLGSRTRLSTLTFPALLAQVDWIVSMPSGG